MTWRITSFSAESGEGTVVSPHFGPLAFGPLQNASRTTDFEIGEAVVLDLESRNGSDAIRSVMPHRQRMPPGTHDPIFRTLNTSAFGDVYVEERGDDFIRFWIGDCCDRCSIDPARVTFSGADPSDFPEEDDELGNPYFRLASTVEIASYGKDLAAGRRLYCIETDYDVEVIRYTPDGLPALVGRRYFLAAEAVEVLQGVSAVSEFPECFGMRDGGASPEETYRRAKERGLGDIDAIRMLRVVYGLTLVDAKEAMIRGSGTADSLVEHQERLLPELQAALEEMENEKPDRK